MPAQLHATSLNFGEARLDALQRRSFDYFLRETNPENGLVADKSQPGSPASIAAVGFGLSAYLDSTFLFAGMLAAAAYFDHEDENEQAVRTLADALYRRAHRAWACNGAATVTHGLTPEGDFLPYRACVPFPFCCDRLS